MRPYTLREQELIDIMVSCCMMIHTSDYFKDKTTEEVGDWIRKQLVGCGHNSVAVDLKHVRLCDLDGTK